MKQLLLSMPLLFAAQLIKAVAPGVSIFGNDGVVLLVNITGNKSPVE